MPRTESRRREQHKLDTREAIEDAALVLFAEHGYDATRVDDIAAAAGVSPRTFFRYFDTKDEVLYTGRHDRLARLHELVVAGDPALDDLAALEAALVAVAPSIEADRERMVLRIDAARSTPVLRGRLFDVSLAWEATMAGALRARRRAGRSADLTAAVAMAAFRHAAAGWIEDRSGRPSLARRIRASFAQVRPPAPPARRSGRAGSPPRR